MLARIILPEVDLLPRCLRCDDNPCTNVYPGDPWGFLPDVERHEAITYSPGADELAHLEPPLAHCRVCGQAYRSRGRARQCAARPTERRLLDLSESVLISLGHGEAVAGVVGSIQVSLRHDRRGHLRLYSIFTDLGEDTNETDEIAVLGLVNNGHLLGANPIIWKIDSTPGDSFGRMG
jgi:hypothetical protein